MKRFFTIVLLLLLPAATISAQEEKMVPVASPMAFQERLKQETAGITSIESDFTQEKYVDVFSEKIVSKGRFYYGQNGKIRMDYLSPLPYRVVIDGEKLTVVSEGKSNTIHIGSNQPLKEIEKMISACMTGNFTGISSSYKLDCYETPSQYVIKIRPLSENVQAYISEIRVSLDKKEMSVKSLRLSEAEKDYTEFLFTNNKYNTLITDETFAVP